MLLKRKGQKQNIFWSVKRERKLLLYEYIQCDREMTILDPMKCTRIVLSSILDWYG